MLLCQPAFFALDQQINLIGAGRLREERVRHAVERLEAAIASRGAFSGADRFLAAVIVGVDDPEMRDRLSGGDRTFELNNSLFCDNGFS